MAWIKKGWVRNVGIPTAVFATVGIYAALWFLLRSGSRRSRRRQLVKAAIVVWVIVALPVGLFASLTP